MTFTYLTAGESHGPQLTGIIEGLPAGLTIDLDQVNTALADRQRGYGRGHRQQIEHDRVQVCGGLRHGVTLGSPLVLTIKNRDHAHWSEIMAPTTPATPTNTTRKVTRPRPGHADLVGGRKYDHADLRNVLERSSARETAIRVAIGNVCEQLLAQVGIQLASAVTQVGPLTAPVPTEMTLAELKAATAANDLRLVDPTKLAAIHQLIDQTRRAGDTLGGTVVVIAENVPAGLGSYTSWDTKLDAKLAAAVMGVNAIKGVEIGDGFAAAARPGSQVMDPITFDPATGFARTSNHLGGFEGGMTTGMPIVITAAMKPIPTLYHPLATVDLMTMQPAKANVERSDTTAIVPAALVVENVVAIELVRALCAAFPSDELTLFKKSVAAWRERMNEGRDGDD